MRNTMHLSKGYLEKIMRLCVMNSLMTTKIVMYGVNAKVRINKETSLSCLPAFEVDKKQ